MNLARWTRRRLPHGLHAWLPWLLAALFCIAGELLFHHLTLAGCARDLWRAPMWSTIVLFLAIRRHWNHDGAAFEWVAFGALAPAAWLGGRALGAAAWLPFAALGGTLPGYAAWRFAPDIGPRDRLWLLDRAVRRPLQLVIAAVTLVVAATSCDKRSARGEARTAPGPREYLLCGEVVALAPARGAVLVKHDEIRSYMPPMTMELTFEPADAANLGEGKRFRAKLVDDGTGTLRLRAVEPLDDRKEAEIKHAALALRQDTHIRGSRAHRELGETVPSFAFYDQDGNVFSIDRVRGRMVVMNFIYTRCPIATMCPLSTQHMMDLQRVAKERGVTGLQLISISLDPAYDTPAVLKAYSQARGIDNGNFSFLTGPASAVRDLLHQFGVLVASSENSLKHTLSTVLIDEKGKIIHRVDSSQWTPDDFLPRLKRP
jgi:protein SCO1/2